MRTSIQSVARARGRAGAMAVLLAAAILSACVDPDLDPDAPLGAAAQEVDTTPPTITLSGPATVLAPGTVNLTATASDASGIAKVRFFRGLTQWSEDTTAPYTAAIPVSYLDLGTQYYVALAWDRAGNVAMATAIMVQVLPVSRPIVASFTATPGSLPYGGGTVTVAWEVLGASQVTVSPPLDAQHQATITASTVFTLTATNVHGTTTSTRAVLVGPPLPPTINSFTATPTSLPIGGGAATLSWDVDGAAQVSIDQGIGDVTGTTSRGVTPTATTTYTLSATSVGGTVTAHVTIDVATPPPPRYLVGPGGVDAGDCLATPCRTIAYAAAQAAGAGLVVLLDGTYDTATQGTAPINLPAGTRLVADHPSQATVKCLLVFGAGGDVDGVRIDRRAPGAAADAGIKATGGTLHLAGVDFAGRFDAGAITATGTAEVTMVPGAVADYTALTEAVPSWTVQPRAFVRVSDSARVTIDGGTFGGPGMGCACGVINNGVGSAMQVADTAALTLDHVIVSFHTRGVAVLGAGRFDLHASNMRPHATSAVGGYGVLLQSQLLTNGATARLELATIDGLGVLASGIRTYSSGTAANLELFGGKILNAGTGVAVATGTSLAMSGQFATFEANATSGVHCDGACDIDLAHSHVTSNASGTSGAGGLWLGSSTVTYHLRLRDTFVVNNTGGPNAANNSGVVLRGDAASTFDLGTVGDPGGNVLLGNWSGASTSSLLVGTTGVTVNARDNQFEANEQGADGAGAYPHGVVTGCGRNFCVSSGTLSM